MEINIEDEKAIKLAYEVADMTGETVEEAITVALRIKLKELKEQSKQQGRGTNQPA